MRRSIHNASAEEYLHEYFSGDTALLLAFADIARRTRNVLVHPCTSTTETRRERPSKSEYRTTTRLKAVTVPLYAAAVGSYMCGAVPVCGNVCRGGANCRPGDSQSGLHHGRHVD